jgi:fructose-1,6-bisphosphatase/sedoheptulose 1,7-bisphosphatase-like protein
MRRAEERVRLVGRMMMEEMDKRTKPMMKIGDELGVGIQDECSA